MAFGSIKADNIIYDDGTGEVTASVQSLANAGASITANAANIATNTSDISTNSTNIATNTANITTNTTDIATNATNIATNTASITSNTTAIATKAPIDSPAFTGTPSLTTGPASTVDDTTIADCAYVGDRIDKLEGTWTAISSATNLVAFTKYLLDSTSGVFTVTLPASPSIGDVITLADQTGQYSTNNVTVAQNGNNINGSANDLVLDVDRSVARLIWSGNATVGWFVK